MSDRTAEKPPASRSVPHTATREADTNAGGNLPTPGEPSAARVRFVVRGQVQGVGFRPFVFTLAEEEGLTGFVRNSPRGVVVEVQGPSGSLDRFRLALEHRLPPLARITHLDREPLPPVSGEQGFCIAPSTAGACHAVLISPDTATCPDCLADMGDGRRRRYPFTNCTNCGPRYTITRSIPYDRTSTSMACFPMCPDCLAEYENPRDRRFHAQPNACPICGPEVWFVGPREEGPEEPPTEPSGRPETTAQTWPRGDSDSQYRRLPATTDPHSPGPGMAKPWRARAEPTSEYHWLRQHNNHPRGDAAMRALAVFLLRGGIAAIKGLGGFHLACLATDHAAVTRLRERKHRPHKPFALMAANLEAVRRFAEAGPAEAALLLGPERPIVLCPLSITGRARLSPAIAPDAGTIGVMLPYTPLHHVLFEHLAESAQPAPGRGGPETLTALVMTSGNPGGEPICLGNREALEHLGGMAEAFLFHNRDILVRTDDSVVRPLPDGQCLFLRRARGYVPRPVPLAGQDVARADEEPCVLGVGAELKNTLCLTKGTDAFVSQHIGDMGNLETAAFHAAMRGHLADLLRVEPRAVVRDLHPDFLSSRMAEELAAEKGLPLFTLQHHFAHAHALLAEHRFRGKALVFALDGTGLGDDGTLWGGELLLVDTGREPAPAHARLASFSPMDLPGGEAAIREPWRIAHALLLRLELDTSAIPLPWLPEYRTVADLLPAVLARRVNTPVSTSCGRLFDAVAALLGLCNATSYEGQAAIRLEQAQYADPAGAETFPKHDVPNAAAGPCPGRTIYTAPVTTLADGRLEFGSHALFSAVYTDLARGIPVPAIARCFHRSLAVGLAELAAQVAGREGVRHIGLSGGCLQNAALAVGLKRELELRGLIPLTHIALPPGDGCISLGQAAYGRSLLIGRSQPGV